MKRILRLLLACMPIGVCAQPAMSQADAQQMMQQAEKMRAYMAQLDQAAMMALSEKAQAMERELKSLCRAGKRDQAQQRAIEFGLEMAANDEMKKLRRCGEMMQGIMPKIGMETVEEMKQRHVCDGY
jgi:hypothetical protein